MERQTRIPDVDPQRLLRLAGDLTDLAATLMPEEQREGRVSAARVRRIIDARKLRGRVFDPSFFSDPAWDILLELYACHLEAREINVTRLTAAVLVPPTTVLRWLARLELEGFLSRELGIRAGRRGPISLSELGVAHMGELMAAIEGDPRTRA